MINRIRILISGRVQGTHLRQTARRLAEAQGLAGFARNLPDGRVEIIAEGEESGLRALLDWSYRGSLLSKVEGLSFDWQKTTGEFKNFSVVRANDNFVADQVHAFTNLGRRVLNRLDKKVDKITAISNVPKHVVIIPDGNRRWAKEHGLLPWEGHREGMERTKELLRAADTLGVKNMTLWGFSTENWSRPAEEVSWLMRTFTRAVKDLGTELVKNQVSFRHLGRKDRLEPKLLEGLNDLERRTERFKGKTFAMALDYGGRDEIVRAAKFASEHGGVSDKSLSAALDTRGLPDPDFIIRTSGEQRLSGILPWQGVYAELYFTPLHFPDFTPGQFQLALIDYSQRQRRFGL